MGIKRLCCGEEHAGAVCPDGLVMCCICFKRFPVDALCRNNGVYEDVCRHCASCEGCFEEEVDER